MELNKCLKERRSNRTFLHLEIPFGKIVKILDSGRYAPTSGNIQNQFFIVIKDQKQIEKIAEACKQSFVKKANYLIAVCANNSRISKLYGKRGENLYSIQNCAATIQNMLLEAYSLGIGSCWIGTFDDDKISRILELENTIKPQAIIALGYTKEKSKAKRNDLENFVFFEHYGNRKKF